jgi:hypothetical protein
VAGSRDTGYWPGFVDALTNVVIAMVFVVVVLAIALSFSAQLLAKRMAAKAEQMQRSQQVTMIESPTPAQGTAPGDTAQPDAGVPARTVIRVAAEQATAPAAPRVRAADQFVVFEFEPQAVSLDEAARTRARDGLAPLATAVSRAGERGRITLVATGPSLELSENQRAAFLRLMAVRNELLAQGVPAGQIQTRLDAKSTARTPAVSVRFGES